MKQHTPISSHIRLRNRHTLLTFVNLQFSPHHYQIKIHIFANIKVFLPPLSFTPPFLAMNIPHFIPLLLLLLAFASAKATTLSTTDFSEVNPDSSRQVTRNIEQLTDGFRVTYHIKSFQLVSNPANEKDQIHLEGFSTQETQNGLKLPWRNDAFVVPQNHSATVEIESASCNELDIALPYNYSLAIPLSTPQGYFPINTVAEENRQTYRKHTVLNIGISPVQYDIATSRARIYSKIVYRITYRPQELASRSSKIANRIDTLSSVPGNLIPGIAFPLPYDSIKIDDYLMQSTPADAGYLIISTPELANGVNRFAAWKRMLGYNVNCLYQPSWTTEEIKSAIQDCYQRDDRLLYLLFVGSNNKVPGVELQFNFNGKEVTYVSDFPYACIDGDDDTMADLFRGRWATDDAGEVEAIVDKIMHYEQHPTQDSIFYRTGVHCSYFQYDPTIGFPSDKYFNMERGTFVKSSEDARNYVCFVDKPNSSRKEVERIYWENKIDGRTPLAWDFRDYWSGEMYVPDDVLEEIALQKSFDDFRNAIQYGRFYALYRGHGSPTQLDSNELSSYFTTRDAYSLNNNEWLTLFLSICCDTGDFRDNCFAQSLLSNECGGSIATIAASSSAEPGYNATLTCALLNAVWPTPGYFSTLKFLYDFSFTGEKPIYQVGQILDKALNTTAQYYKDGKNYDLYTKQIFHCFGDPSTMFTTEVPDEFQSVSCHRSGNYLSVRISDEKGYISIFDHTTDSVKRIYGDYLYYACAHPENVSVVVSGHNKIPFISPAKGYTTSGETERQSASRIVRCIDQGGVLQVDYELGAEAKNAKIMALDLSNNMIRADVPVSGSSGSVGLHIPYGIYAIVLYGENIAMHTVRVIVSRNGR